jgi:LacI family transcriptional regulator
VSISEETRQRVLEAVEELGYVPDIRAQTLRSGDTKTIGLIIPDIRNPHFWEAADGAEQEARASGYHLILSSADLNPEHGKDIFKDLSGRRIDGLILMGAFIFQSEEAQKTLNRLVKRQFPIVKLAEHPDIDCVISAYDEVTKEVISYLLSLQHRRIGLIYGVLPHRDSPPVAGLPVDQELIVTCGPTIEDGYQAALQLLRLPSRPTALIAINDLLAIGALRAAADLGLTFPQTCLWSVTTTFLQPTT